MAVKPIWLVEGFYAPSSFTVIEHADDFLVKFHGVDFSAPAEQETRSALIRALAEHGHLWLEDYTDLIILKAGDSPHTGYGVRFRPSPVFFWSLVVFIFSLPSRGDTKDLVFFGVRGIIDL